MVRNSKSQLYCIPVLLIYCWCCLQLMFFPQPNSPAADQAWNPRSHQPCLGVQNVFLSLIDVRTRSPRYCLMPARAALSAVIVFCRNLLALAAAIEQNHQRLYSALHGILQVDCLFGYLHCQTRLGRSREWQDFVGTLPPRVRLRRRHSNISGLSCSAFWANLMPTALKSTACSAVLGAQRCQQYDR